MKSIRNNSSRIVAALVGVMLSCCAMAEMVVVVHPANPSALTRELVRDIFLGKVKKFPNGQQAIPVEIATGETRKEFLEKILMKTEPSLSAYWSRMIFTGRATPPLKMESSAAMRKEISINTNLIGFMDAAEVDASVRVVRF